MCVCVCEHMRVCVNMCLCYLLLKVYTIYALFDAHYNESVSLNDGFSSHIHVREKRQIQ